MARKRAIFEDVSEDHQRVTHRGGIEAQASRGRSALRFWFATLFSLVVLMVLIGGLTRLTDSGLSITEWKPILGALPPLSAQDWQEAFVKYQAIPEYQLQNKGMSLSEFKVIYWWEWGHRQFGRLIGVVWFLGFALLWATKRMPPAWRGPALGVGMLGLLQGAIGWWMVASGLTGTMLDVASYRLAVHLGLAFVILGFLSWYVIKLGYRAHDLLQAQRHSASAMRFWANMLLGAVFVQILLGALVAGIDAGRNYTDWPLMAGGFLPPDLFMLEPLWRNFFEDDGLVQLMHRLWGYLVFFVLIVAWQKSRKMSNNILGKAFALVLLAGFAQIVMGVVTVMHSSPLPLAISHQALAILLWVLVVRARFLACYPPVVSIREG